MIKLLLTVSFVLFGASCASKTGEKESAEYWKNRYEKLRRFVEAQGLGDAADRALDAPKAKHVFYVGVKSYKFNGKVLFISKISEAASEINPKTQRVNIIVSESAPHQNLLILLDGLNREGIENFNLVPERNQK